MTLTIDLGWGCADVRRECTPEEGKLWRERFGDGYKAGRGDARWNAGPRMPLVDIPADLPGETGAEYVARHVGQAWEIGYARAWTHTRRRCAA